MIKSYNEFESLRCELSMDSTISNVRDRNDFISTVELMLDVLNNQWFNEDSENALDDPEAIQAMQDLKDGKIVSDGDYLSDCIEFLLHHFEDAERNKAWGDVPWKQLFGWS